MKKILLLFILLTVAVPYSLWGQSLEAAEEETDVECADTLEADRSQELLSLPAPRTPFLLTAPGFDGCSPWYMGTYGPSWDLHEGFNAQLGMSISAGLGKHAPSGVGFGQTANLAYALPLNKRFSAAAGLYMQNMDWGSFHQRDVGIAATLGFKVNEVISLYTYGTKSFMPKRHRQPIGYFPLYMDQFRDRIGAMAEFKLGEHAKIQVSVEHSSGNNSSIPVYCVPDGK